MFVSRFIQSEQTSCMVFLNQFKIKLLVILFHRKHINYFQKNKNMIIFKGDCFRNKKQTFYMVFKKKESLLQGNTVTKSTLIRLHQAKSIKHIVMMQSWEGEGFPSRDYIIYNLGHFETQKLHFKMELFLCFIFGRQR